MLLQHLCMKGVGVRALSSHQRISKSHKVHYNSHHRVDVTVDASRSHTVQVVVTSFRQFAAPLPTPTDRLTTPIASVADSTAQRHQ